jgi:DsbC/DsbD-like thiol-disulfide interchange protein
MIIRSACTAAIAAILLGALPAAASDRIATEAGSLQLVAGARTETTADFGLVIDLAPGWKTYWRTPGDSGVPPRFDTGASRNVASLAVDYPAPHRFGDADAPSLGYAGRVVLPIRVSLAKAGDPARLTLNVQLGLCKEICIPLMESLSADTAVRPDAVNVAMVSAARLALPRPAIAGEGPSAKIVSLTHAPGHAPVLTFKVASADGRPVDDVFAEGGEAWDLPQPRRVSGADGESLWRLDLDGLPAAYAAEHRKIRLTMVAGNEAREQMLALPEPAGK